jgi:alanine racemase
VTFTYEEIAERGHPVWAEIDLGALRHNIQVLGSIAQPAELMAVVKGYAYGHGNPVCAQVALEAGATRLGVARVAEAFHLRESGVTAPIHVFTEPPPEAAQTIVKHGLTATVYTQAFADALGRAAAKQGTSVPVHVKLDTGMHRVGLSPDDALDAVSRMRKVDGITVEGAWTHLAVADVPDHPFTRKQLDLFDDLVGKIEASGTPLEFKHVANSAATLSLPEARYDIVRCGIACYGLWPGEQLVGAADLRPVMSLKARINMVKRVPAGEGLSYGLSYELERPGRVVTVPAGYADGYDRRLSGKGDVLIEGQRFRVSGTVCMDQFMADVGSNPVEPGMVATLLGEDGSERVTAEELAALVGTINYEVTARIPSRVPRIYLGAK